MKLRVILLWLYFLVVLLAVQSQTAQDTSTSAQGAAAGKGQRGVERWRREGPDGDRRCDVFFLQGSEGRRGTAARNWQREGG